MLAVWDGSSQLMDALSGREMYYPFRVSAYDSNTYANVEVAKMTHFDIQARVDFEKKTLDSVLTMQLTAL